jgi:hypothetical protein
MKLSLLIMLLLSNIAGANNTITETINGKSRIFEIGYNDVEVPVIQTLPRFYSGKEALTKIDIEKFARDTQVSVEELEKHILYDGTLKVDNNGMPFYVEPVFEGSEAAAISKTAVKTVALPNYNAANVFKLHTNPNSKKKLFLQFKGDVVTNTAWNEGTITAGDYSSDKKKIFEVWSRVAEDYAPFDIDVTTEFTTADAINRTNEADDRYGVKVVITTTDIGWVAGGIAYVGLLDYYDKPGYYNTAWVLPNYLNHSAKNIAEAVSHEVGHTLGLLHSGTIEHDGVTAVGYYDGGAYGDLKTSWVPIMGVPYYKNVSQFTKGDYKYADKQVDQFAVINSKGVDYVKDLAGDTLIDAALLSYKGNVNGIIGVNDVDYYSISVTHSAINIKIDTAKVGGNLDAKVTLLASDGSKVVSDNVKDELNAMIKIKVPNGNYFVRVEGVGRTGINGDEGYSSYGSVGRYTISYQ